MVEPWPVISTAATLSSDPPACGLARFRNDAIRITTAIAATQIRTIFAGGRFFLAVPYSSPMLIVGPAGGFGGGGAGVAFADEGVEGSAMIFSSPPILRRLRLRCGDGNILLRIVILGDDVLAGEPGHQRVEGQLRISYKVCTYFGAHHAAAQHIFGVVPDMPADCGSSRHIEHLGADVSQMRRHRQDDPVNSRGDARVAGIVGRDPRRLEVAALPHAVEPELAGDRLAGLDFAVDVDFHARTSRPCGCL